MSDTTRSNNSNALNALDCVSRQAAIDAIEKHLNGVFDGTHYDEGIAYGYEAAHRHIQEVINALPSAQPEQQWIPVTERLPERKSFALVTDFGEVEEAYYDSDGSWWQIWGDRLKNVTAWMPLPEPWKGGEADV